MHVNGCVGGCVRLWVEEAEVHSDRVFESGEVCGRVDVYR